MKVEKPSLPLLSSDDEDMEHLETERFISILKLLWFVHLESEMDFERFRYLVRVEDDLLAAAVDRRYSDSHHEKALQHLRVIGLDIAPDAYDEGQTEEDVYAEMARVFTGIDRGNIRDKIAVSNAFDIEELFNSWQVVVRECEDWPFPAIFNEAIKELQDLAEELEAVPRHLNNVLKNVRRVFQSRILPLEAPLVSTIQTISREYISWLQKHPDVLDTIAWEAFENLIAEILASHGFEVDITARCRNRSADLIALRTDELGAVTKYLIECKRFRNDRYVDLSVVNAVLGAKVRASADHAFLVTTSRFSRDVQLMKPELQDLRLHLREGEAVKEWLQAYRFSEGGRLWLPEEWHA